MSIFDEKGFDLVQYGFNLLLLPECKISYIYQCISRNKYQNGTKNNRSMETRKQNRFFFYYMLLTVYTSINLKIWT